MEFLGVLAGVSHKNSMIGQDGALDRGVGCSATLEEAYMDFSAISWLGVVLAAIAFFGVGAIWYGALFARPWMRLSGVTEEQARSSNLVLIFGTTGVLGVVAAIGLAAVIGEDSSAGAGLGIGLGIGALIVAPVLGIQSLYDRKALVLWALNAGYNLAGFAIMGLVIGALQ
jgi:hypothetical protein